MSPIKRSTDPSQDVLRQGIRPLSAIFEPEAIAVVGATEQEGSVGRAIFHNLTTTPFAGAVFPVNPKRDYVLGIKAYPSIAAIRKKVDLAVIATPAPAVPAIITQCVEAGVKGAIIISAGFRETGAEGVALERRILEEARRGGMRIVGPNCLGVMNPSTGMNATFAAAMAGKGNVGFISQSGALCTAVLDWSLRERVGFSSFISVGAMLDVGWGDLIDYLGDDPATESILMYMESIGDARSFLSAAREVALRKPIIVIKVGRTPAAAKAAASHTGALTGSDEVLDAAFRRCGVLRVDRIADLFSMAEVLAKQPRPKGSRLAIITNAGGPGVLAADTLSETGGQLASLAPNTMEALNKVLPTHWSRSNPVDILGDAGPERYARALDIVARDPGSDGLLVILTPQAMTDPAATAEKLTPYAQLKGKPVLASWMGAGDVQAAKDILQKAGIPAFDYPDTAARMFQYLWKYSYNLRGLYETPVLPASSTGAEALKLTYGKAGGTLLSEIESKKLLATYGIPVVETRLAKTSAEAVRLAKKIGYPVVLKLHSETVTHKTDVGGVALDLPDAGSVREAYRNIESSVHKKAGQGAFQGVTVQPFIRPAGYELILGSSIDPQFGPVLLFGAGGQMVEIFHDHALALPPLNTTLARRMMEQTRIFQALRGIRGRKPVDMAKLEELLVLFSRLVVEQPRIKEIDINPLLASPEGLIALDARVVLHEPGLSQEDLPKPAIRPYPVEYARPWKMGDGSAIAIRPIRPEDEPAMVRFHETLSGQSVYFRYFHMIGLDQRVAHERLTRVCFNDYDREIALVAERKGFKATDGGILAVGRLSRQPGTRDAEFAMLVSDKVQHQGLGTELLRRLVDIGRRENLYSIRAQILPDNLDMQHVCEKLGFTLDPSIHDGIVTARLDLASDSRRPRVC